MNDATASAIGSALAFVVGVIGSIIAYFVYKLGRHQQKETWVRTYREIHETFWNDPIMAKVRYWINYDRAYLEIKPILQKRKIIDEGSLAQEELLESEYKCLDDLDKFYNLALEVAALNSHTKIKFEQDFWKHLYFDYWVSDRIRDEKRKELQWYVERFYPELLDSTFPAGKVEKRKTYYTPVKGTV